MFEHFTSKQNTTDNPNALDFIPQDIACLGDYERYAVARLSDNATSYIVGASGDEITKNRNTTAFDELRIKSSVLSQVSEIQSQIKLFDRLHQTPFLLAPIAYQKLAHPLGEVATAQAAAAQSIGMVVSTLSSCSIEAVAEHQQADSSQWFQLYIQPDMQKNISLIKRAERSGYSAIVVTVDVPVNGLRNREHRSAFKLPNDIQAVNLKTAAKEESFFDNKSISNLMAEAPGWDIIGWVKKQTHLPVLIKGIMSKEDALLVLENGGDGIVVSNHGGRSLDCQPASIEVLPEIKQVVQNQIPILLDSGIRRGTDIFKAIALGANAVLLGRSYIYALATAGPLGVAHAIKILKDEFELTMALTGCQTVDDINPSKLWKPSQYNN